MAAGADLGLIKCPNLPPQLYILRQLSVTPLSEYPLQTDQIEDLKRSKALVGELLPVIWDDRTNSAISGSHRMKAGWSKVIHITTVSDEQHWRLKMNYNIQRGVTQDELSFNLSEYGKALEKSGWENGNIVKELKRASGLAPNYAYEFIPKRYLSGEGRPRGPSFRQSETSELPPDVSIGSERSEPEQHLIECSWCHHRGVDIGGVLQDPET